MCISWLCIWSEFYRTAVNDAIQVVWEPILDIACLHVEFRLALSISPISSYTVFCLREKTTPQGVTKLSFPFTVVMSDQSSRKDVKQKHIHILVYTTLENLGEAEVQNLLKIFVRRIFSLCTDCSLSAATLCKCERNNYEECLSL